MGGGIVTSQTHKTGQTRLGSMEAKPHADMPTDLRQHKVSCWATFSDSQLYVCFWGTATFQKTREPEDCSSEYQRLSVSVPVVVEMVKQMHGVLPSKCLL
jgi:hypothetical protein